MTYLACRSIMNSIKTERFLVYRPIGRFVVKVLSSTLHFSWLCTEGWKRGEMSRGRAAFDLPPFFCTYQPNKNYCVSVLYKNSDISYPKFVFVSIFYRGHRSHVSEPHRVFAREKRGFGSRRKHVYSVYSHRSI